MLDGDEIIQVMIWGNKEGIRIKKYDRLQDTICKTDIMMYGDIERI